LVHELDAACAALVLAAAWDRALLHGARVVRAIEPSGTEQATSELRNGERFSARISGRRSVKRFSLALPVRRHGRRTLVRADMLEREAFRTLRLWTLWAKAPGVAPAPLPA